MSTPGGLSSSCLKCQLVKRGCHTGVQAEELSGRQLNLQ